MKCTCSRVDLNDALAAVARAIAIKPSTPVLAGIYMRAADNTLELQATNFSIGVIVRIPANIESPGAIVAAGKYLPTIVSKLGGEIVTLTNENDTATLTLKSEAAAFSLLTMDAEDFPRIKREDASHSFRINAGAFKTLITNTVFACARDESRPVFNGCLFEISGLNINFVATNTHRIAIARSQIFDEIGSLRFIVHAATLRSLLAMLFKSTDSVVTISYSGNSAAFEFDSVFVTSRVIDGAFPPYDRIIPATCDTTAELDVDDLRVAIERMQIIARESEYQTVRCNFTSDGLEISSGASDIGTSVEHVDASVSGGDVTVALNVNYLLDALKVFSSARLRVGMNGALSPIDIRATDDDSFTYVVTPLRTQ